MGQGSEDMLSYEKRMKEWQRGGLPSQDLQRYREGAEVPGSLWKPELLTSAAPTM